MGFGIRVLLSGWRYPELPADGPCGIVVHLAVPRNRALATVGRVDPDGVRPPLTQGLASVRAQVAQQLDSLHDTAPVGTSRTSVLTTKCR
jgi:hypothetical protein